jgi:hypothetical protein
MGATVATAFVCGNIRHLLAGHVGMLIVAGNVRFDNRTSDQSSDGRGDEQVLLSFGHNFVGFNFHLDFVQILLGTFPSVFCKPDSHLFKQRMFIHAGRRFLQTQQIPAVTDLAVLGPSPLLRSKLISSCHPQI